MIHLKFIPLSAAFLFAVELYAQNADPAASQPSTTGETGITGDLLDEESSLTDPNSEPIEFEVKRSLTKRVYVEESPEMHGLPAPKGTINVTVQLVEDPGLPDPPPLAALPPDDPTVVERMEDLQSHHQNTRIVFVSATVYDHSRTFFRCTASGEGTSELSGWSNLDFNHFCEFSTYPMTGPDGETREYGLLMGIGNEEREQSGESSDQDADAPQIPNLPDLVISGPSFVVTGGDTADRETMALVEGMHEFYRTEGQQMKEAYQARIKAYEERRTYLLANPPKPKDVMIQFWKPKNKPQPTPDIEEETP